MACRSRPGGNETVSLSAASTPALYLAGNSGIATEVNTTTGTGTNAQVTTTPADQTGRLTKIGDLAGTPTAIFSANQDATTGTTTAPGDGGGFQRQCLCAGQRHRQFRQPDQPGHARTSISPNMIPPAMWCGSNLVGSAGTASGYGLALDPAGGVVVTGASTADLTTTSVADGNNDSFVASYDANGNQTWIQQIQTLATNQANAVSVDASGNIYIGGSVSGGVIGAGQTAQGGGDAYLAKFDSKGNLLAENQFGTSGADQVSATATGSDGSLYVASVQNGDAVVSKYAGGDITSAPTWTQDLGALSVRRRHRRPDGFGQPGLCLRHHQQRQSDGGRRRPASPRPPAAAPTPLSSISPTMAPRATANHVSYVGTSASDQGGARDGRPRRHRLSDRHHHRHLRRPAAQRRRMSPTPSPPRSTPMAACNGPSNMAAPPASPPAPAWRSIPMAPACWTRWACRAAPSTSTSRWT